LRGDRFDLFEFCCNQLGICLKFEFWPRFSAGRGGACCLRPWTLHCCLVVGIDEGGAVGRVEFEIWGLGLELSWAWACQGGLSFGMTVIELFEQV